MGTSYDIRCLDCGENAGVHAPWDPIAADYVRAFIPHAAAIGNLAPLTHEVEAEGVNVSTAWMGKHAQHRLRAVSEYGEVDGACSKRIECAHCGASRGYCEREADHPGDCGKESKHGP